jgi:predicted nucleic acid-binding protein
MIHGRPDDLIDDGMMAATAAVHNLTVVSRNTRDFERLGARVFNPFSGSGD